MCASCPDGQTVQQSKCTETKGKADVLLVIVPIVATVLLIAVYYKANDPTTTYTSKLQGGGLALGLAVTVIQLIGTLGRLPLSWPSGFVGDALVSSEVFLFDPDTLSAEAIIGFDPLKGYLVKSILPYAYIAWAFMLWAFTNVIGVMKRNRFGWKMFKLFNSLGTILQTLFIALAGLAAVPHQCYSHPNDNGASVVEYPSVLCGQGDYLPMVILSFLLLGTLIVPFMAVSVYATVRLGKKRRARTNVASHLQPFRFLVYRFRPDVWWWGTIFNIRQILLAFCSMVQPDDPHFQLIFVVLILTWYACATLGFCPWRTIEANLFDCVSCCLLTLLVATVGSLMPASELSSKHEFIVSFVLVGLFCGAGCNLILALSQVLCTGREAQSGSSYSKHKLLSTFAVEWQALGEVCSKLPPEGMVCLLANMNDYDRRYLDKAMCSVQAASGGQIHVTEKCSARLQGIPPNHKPSMLPMHSEDVKSFVGTVQALPDRQGNEDAEQIQVFVSERCRFAASKHLTLTGASRVRVGM